MKVALLQTKSEDSKEKNLEKILTLMKRVGSVDVVCLPELFLTHYFPQEKHNPFTSAESIPGPTTDTLSKVAKQYCVVLVGGTIFEKEGNKYYNTCPVFDSDGTLLGKYRKIHIPNDPQYWEKYYFSPGDLGYQVFDTKIGKIGVGICYDQWYPEVARILALKGAQIIFYPTAIGWTKGMEDAPEEAFADQNWIDVQRMHAVANHVFVAATNRTGTEKADKDYIKFWGQSFVATPFGNVLRQAKIHDEEVITTDCDLSLIEKSKSWGFVANRVPETYGGLTK